MEKPMENPWKTHGNPMENPWKTQWKGSAQKPVSNSPDFGSRKQFQEDIEV
jgi:hypothetical protein